MGYFTVGNIKCPNCDYEGKAKAVGSGFGAFILAVALIIISFFFWPLFIVAIL